MLLMKARRLRSGEIAGSDAHLPRMSCCGLSFPLGDMTKKVRTPSPTPAYRMRAESIQRTACPDEIGLRLCTPAMPKLSPRPEATKCASPPPSMEKIVIDGVPSPRTAAKERPSAVGDGKEYELISAVTRTGAVPFRGTS